MKFKIDENLPYEVADLLNAAGYDALTVLDQSLGGQSDLDISVICKNEERVIVTLDVDFADILTYPPIVFSGIIVMRLKRQDKPNILAVISRIIPLFKKEKIKKKLWIVNEETIRIRGED